MSVRWNTLRLEKKVTEAFNVSKEGLQSEYERGAVEVANETSRRITSSGRGGAHNAEFANIEHRVFQAQSGRWNILVGWLHPSANAHEKGSGGKLWYQYQDTGFNLFGGNTWIEGVGATLDQRDRLIEVIEDVNRKHISHIAGILNR